MKHDWRVQDQVIIVTGASKGIGLATAQALLARGARVAMFARGEAALRDATASVDATRVMPNAVDVSDRAALDTPFDEVGAKWGRIAGLVNNVAFNVAARLAPPPKDTN